ncbi:endothelin-converting enzyme 2-like [Rhipicephalus microplus]|uniref:endothelin-converting enzyme 2-like n=1 Tax=Rhipicephalus microplus TaxID=6941 RepID=UPI003F6BB422
MVGTFLLLPIDPSHRLEIKSMTTAVCVSPSCLQDASYLNTLLSWDRVDPCVDFYAFVCDRWTSQYTTSKHTSFPETFDDDYAALLENRIYSMIINKSLESHSLRPIRQLYEKCLSIARTDEEGWDPILELMFDMSLEGFPLTPPIRSSKSVWEMAAKFLRKTGSSAIFGVGVAAHSLKGMSRDFLSVELPEILMRSDDIDINDATQLYTEAMFCALKALKKEYLPPVHALSVVKFASNLEKLVHRVGLTGAGRPVVEVLDASSELLIFFTELLQGAENVPFSVTGSEVVLQYPSAVRDTISLVHETEVHTVMNYLGIRLIAEMSPFLPRTEMVDFQSTLLYGKRKVDVPRPQLCVRMIEKAMSPLIVVSVISELTVDGSPTFFPGITGELFKGIMQQINASSYFDTYSNDAIRRLMSRIELRVLRPNWLTEPVLLEQYVNGFSSAANQSGFQYYIESHEHTFMSSLGRSSLQRWMRPVFTTNCWVELAPPAIYVPLLAFDITHSYGVGVDEHQLSRLSRHLAECVLHFIFDYTSAMTNDHQRWLSEQSEKRLLGAEICMNASAGQPLFRRVSDVLAVHYAYTLFCERSKGKEAQVVRLSVNRVLSWRQLFFVKLMLEACETSAHLGRTRSKVGEKWTMALRNSDDFAAAYDCRLGSPMNARKKCVL